MESVFALLGFSLAAYSVVGNDSIQTLGTFLVSNEKRKWWQLWLFAGSIMALVVTLGYLGYGEYLGGKGDDLTFGKYDGIFKGDTVFPTISAWYVLPPLALLFITRLGIPVSTTFLVLTFFAPKALPQMLVKSLGGYGVAFYLLSLVLRSLPVGITYAIWAGLGIVLVTLVGMVVFGEKPDAPALVGIGLIVAGVVLLQVFSKMSVH